MAEVSHVEDWIIILQSWTKVFGHFCISSAFSNSHRPNSSPHPGNNVGRVYPEFFPSFNFLLCGGGRTARKFRKGCTVLRGNREITGKYEYCSAVPRTFVQDCRNCNTTLDGTSQFSGVKAGYSCRSTEPRQAHKEEVREIISSGC